MPTEQENDYKVSLDIFEGPLDLLLYLIRKDELDIYDIPIETITSQYMEYLGAMRIMNLDIAGEFIVMASTLMLIKSRMLLPVEERVEEEEEEDDPRWDLVRQLVEYKKFKDSAYQLHEIELQREGVFGRSGEGVNIPVSSDVVLSDVGLFDLISAFNEALHRVEKENLREIFAEHFTVAEKIDEVRDMLIKQARVSISGIFRQMNSRNEIVCTFLAVLELIRTGLIRLEQERVFGEIWIENQEQDGSS
jgi:segregation and condensation protein A